MHIFFSYFQVLGELLHLTIDYPATKEKIVISRSKAKAVEAKYSTLGKQLIKAMNDANEAKAKLKGISNELKVDKMLITKKDEQIQLTLLKLDSKSEKAIADLLLLETYSIAAFDKYFKSFKLLRRWTMKHHPEDYYSSIDFEAIDKEIMTDEAAEQARANEQAGVRGEEEGEGPENVLVDPHV